MLTVYQKQWVNFSFPHCFSTFCFQLVHSRYWRRNFLLIKLLSESGCWCKQLQIEYNICFIGLRYITFSLFSHLHKWRAHHDKTEPCVRSRLLVDLHVFLFSCDGKKNLSCFSCDGCRFFQKKKKKTILINEVRIIYLHLLKFPFVFFEEYQGNHLHIFCLKVSKFVTLLPMRSGNSHFIFIPVVPTLLPLELIHVSYSRG